MFDVHEDITQFSIDFVIDLVLIFDHSFIPKRLPRVILM